MAAQIFYANDYKYMVCSTPLNATTGYRPFFDLLVYGDNASNQGCLSPGMLICTANPYSDHIDHDNRFDAVIGMPHFDNKAEVNYFKENGAGACFKGSSSNPVMSMLIPDLCKAPSRFILVADSTNAAVTNKVENKGGNWAFYCSSTSSTKLIHLAHRGRSAVGFVDGHAGTLTGGELYADTVNKPRRCIESNGLTITTLE